MAVPKKKKSKSRRNMRRGSNGSYDANLPKVAINKNGEYHLSHHISLDDGSYGDKQVVKVKK